MDITTIRQEMMRLAKEEHPDAINYRISCGTGYDYVEAQFSNELGEFESSIHDSEPIPSYIWMSVGIWSDDVEKRLLEKEAA